jgi:hypothetical protein
LVSMVRPSYHITRSIRFLERFVPFAEFSERVLELKKFFFHDVKSPL